MLENAAVFRYMGVGSNNLPVLQKCCDGTWELGQVPFSVFWDIVSCHHQACAFFWTWKRCARLQRVGEGGKLQTVRRITGRELFKSQQVSRFC